MTKEELRKEADIFAFENRSPCIYDDMIGWENDHEAIKNGYLAGAEPREKRIEELEKENAELKKNYEDSLIACGVLENKVELLAQPSPLESMQDVLITTQKSQNEKQKKQLTKAKEILKGIVQTPMYYQMGGEMYESEEYKELIVESEQFLKEADK